MTRALVALQLLMLLTVAPDAVPQLDIDVAVGEGRTAGGEPLPGVRTVDVSLTDLSAGCPHETMNRPEPGHCGEWSDVRDPPCGTWHCLREIRVESAEGVLGRTEVAHGGTDEGTRVGFLVPAGARDTRVVLEGCGQRAELPFSTALPSAPEVTRVTRLADGFEVAWAGTEDAAVIEVRDGNGFGGTVCALRERTPAKLRWNSREHFSGLGARSAIVERSTPFGRAHIWQLHRMRFDDGLFPADNTITFAPIVLVEHPNAAAPLAVEVRLNPFLDGNGRASRPWPPDPYRCRPASDGIASNHDGPECVTGLRLEVDGRRAAALDQLRRVRDLPFRLELPEVPPGARVELVIEGCARDSARLALPTEPLAAPTITRFTQAGDDFVFEWTGAPGATSALASVNDVISGQTCHSYGRGAVTVSKHEGERKRSTLRAVAADATVDTAFGPVQIWRVSPTVSPP